MSSNMFRRTTVGALAIAGALGLAACNNDTASVSTPTGSQSTATSKPSTPSSAPTTESSAPETSTSEAADPTTSSEAPSKPVTGPTKATDPKGTLKFGQPAVIVDDDDTFRLTATSLTVAPDSAYSEANLSKSNGKLYYLKFDVTPIKTDSKYFSVNGLFFHPEIASSVKNAKRLYGDTDACSSDSKPTAIGQTQSSCYIYQIPGATVSNVVYNDYQHNIRWTK